MKQVIEHIKGNEIGHREQREVRQVIEYKKRALMQVIEYAER